MTECFGGMEGKANFALLAGTLYILFGVLQGVVLLNIVNLPLIPGNAMSIPILLIIGLVFIFGYREMMEGIPEGISFVYVGIMLSLIFCGLYLLVLAAHSFSTYLLKSEDFQDWTFMDGIRPEIYLAALSVWAYFRWKDDFIHDQSSIKIEVKNGDQTVEEQNMKEGEQASRREEKDDQPSNNGGKLPKGMIEKEMDDRTAWEDDGPLPAEGEDQ